MTESPSLLLTIIAFFLVLGPLVLVHELGHYLVGRWFGVKADAFSIGFGKELAGWTDRRGTRWKLSALPLGGYVQFAGDMNAASQPAAADDGLSEEERAQTFHTKPLWQRSLIVLAGPLTNLLCAVAIFAAFNLAYGKVVASPEIAEFSESSPAQEAGLEIGDRITSVDGNAIESFTDIPRHVLPYPNRTVSVTIARDGETMVVPVRIGEVIDTDRFGNESRIGRIGIGAGEIEVIDVGPVEAVSLGVEQSIGVMKLMATGIAQIFTGERSIEELGGPVKIAKYSGEQLSLGWSQFVSFAALISINLAFINLLPIPALDGGHLAFYAAEAVRRKPLGLRSQEWAFRTGLALVLALMLIVTINDLATLPVFGG
ncbi:putative zinc metalloprotease [Novosphingobium marinum]|uniref:Zinc metalloprotease n=1 Tax=Novosphingobium marinum TaxID=1514948 RepID=A0A7Z0BWX5_9SPHN|nr:RIP metalloprotease RseP [Novosphingobium marinum]NYH96860.1 regulator of sigma E protease [Novosphingobium marinum]GGC41800.1 putative zinc metalloprotease [Novosphingobium marinum]